MSEISPLIKSHASAEVRQLLSSAQLDVPPKAAQERALRAVAELNHRAATTNFSGIALGTTVHRLIGAVTLYGTQAPPWRLVLRGSAMGMAAGVAALLSITSLRWAQSGNRDTIAASAQSGLVTPPLEATHVGVPSQSDQVLQAQSEAEQDALIRGAMLELDAGRAENALQSANALLVGHPSSKWIPRATVLKVNALMRLRRIAEARVAAQPLLNTKTPEAHELKFLLDAESTKATAP